MELQYFFYNDAFHLDLESLMTELMIDTKDHVEALEDDWSVVVELSDLKPIYQFDMSDLMDIVENSDRLSEDGDELDDVMELLEQNPIDFSVINSKMPRLHYPNKNEAVVTKKDLLEYMNN